MADEFGLPNRKKRETIRDKKIEKTHATLAKSNVRWQRRGIPLLLEFKYHEWGGGHKDQRRIVVHNLSQQHEFSERDAEEAKKNDPLNNTL